jgi:hypothetical protein
VYLSSFLKGRYLMKLNHFRLVMIGLLVLLMGLVGCRESAKKSKTAADVDIQFSVDPAPAVGESSIVVTLADKDGNLINDAKVAVRGDMNHAGMVPVLAETDKSEDGQYTIPFEWTMGGDWIVTVTVTLADGSTAEKPFDVSVMGGMGQGMVAPTMPGG